MEHFWGLQGLQGGGKGSFLEFAGLARGRKGSFLGFAGRAGEEKGGFFAVARCANYQRGVFFTLCMGCKLSARGLFHSLHEMQTLCEGSFLLFVKGIKGYN